MQRGPSKNPNWSPSKNFQKIIRNPPNIFRKNHARVHKSPCQSPLNIPKKINVRTF